MGETREERVEKIKRCIEIAMPIWESRWEVIEEGGDCGAPNPVYEVEGQPKISFGLGAVKSEKSRFFGKPIKMPMLGWRFCGTRKPKKALELVKAAGFSGGLIPDGTYTYDDDPLGKERGIFFTTELTREAIGKVDEVFIESNELPDEYRLLLTRKGLISKYEDKFSELIETERPKVSEMLARFLAVRDGWVIGCKVYAGIFEDESDDDQYDRCQTQLAKTEKLVMEKLGISKVEWDKAENWFYKHVESGEISWTEFKKMIHPYVKEFVIAYKIACNDKIDIDKCAKHFEHCGISKQEVEQALKSIEAKEAAPPEVEKAQAKLKPSQIQSMVYGYIVSHGGELDVDECAEELEIPKSDVEAAIKALKATGKLKKG